MTNKKPEIEIWKPIPNFEGYQVSNWGNILLKDSYDEDNTKPRRGIRVDGKPKKKKPRLSRCKGDIHLSWNGVHKDFKRAQLVLIAFVGVPSTKQEYNARHLDDNMDHNWLTNLAWGTHKDNHADGVRNGKHAKKGTPEALRYAVALKGKPRPSEVKKKISDTKKTFPERQHYAREKGPDGRFIR